MPKSVATKQGFTIVELLIAIAVVAILAAISVVTYRGILDRARTSAVTSSLSQTSNKLDIYKTTEGSYPASLAVVGVSNSTSLKYEYTLGTDGHYCMTATDQNISYFMSSTSKKTAVGGCAGHTWPGSVVLTNLVPNGDFRQGTSSWLGYGASISVVDDSLTATVTNVFGGVAARSTLSPTAVSGRAYYLKYTIKPFWTHQPLVVGLGGPGWMTPKASAGIETAVSGIYTATTPSTYVDLRLNQAGTTMMATGSQVSFKRVLVIDLTTTFGAGKEPTKDQMDQIMTQLPNGWFYSTTTVNTNGIL